MSGQAVPCTYEQCALRIQYRLFDVRVVQGAAETPVGRIALFAPRIEPLATASDTVRFHYAAYRNGQVGGAVLTLVGSVALIGSAAVAFGSAFSTSDANEAAYAALFGAGVVAAFVGIAATRRAQDHLQRAIWLYNRSLAGGGEP